METFPAKISWERPRKRENKKNRSDEFVPNPQLKITKKKSQKIQKIKKHHYRFFSSQNKLGKAEKEKKNIVPMSSSPTRNRKFQKIAKNFKKLKTTILATFQPNISWERPIKREKKKSF